MTTLAQPLPDNQPSTLQRSMDAISSILSAHDRSEALSLAVEAICDVLGMGASAAITLANEQGELELLNHYASGPLAEMLREAGPRADGVTAWVVLHRTAVFEDDVRDHENRKHPKVRTKLKPAGAYACIPLQHEERIYGALFVVFEQAFTFDSDAIASLKAMGRLATRAIELTEQLRVREVQVEVQAKAYSRVSNQLQTTWKQDSPQDDLDYTLHAILQQLDEEVFPNQEISAIIYVYDDDVGFFSGAAIGPLKEYMESKPPRTRGTARFALDRGRPVFVGNADEPADDKTPPLDQVAHAKGVKAFANMPLVVGEGKNQVVNGIIIINLQRTFIFTDHVQSILGSFSDQAAIILQNSRIHRRRTREQRALNKISRSAADGDLQQVGETVTKHAVALSHAVYATLWSVTRTGNEINLVGHYSEREEWNPPGKSLPIDDTSMNGHTVLTGTEYYQTNLNEKHPHYSPWHPEVQSAYCVPLRAGKELVGTLYVASPFAEISRTHRKFIDQVAVTAAIALRTAAHQSTLRKVLDFQQAISDVEPVEEQIEEIQTELARYIDVRHLFIARYSPSSGDIKLDIVYKRGKLDDEAAYARKYSAQTGGGFTDYVIRHGRSLLAPNLDNWENSKEVDEQFRAGVKSAVAVPMRLGDEIVGVLGMRNYDRAYAYGREHLNLLEPIANHIAVVMENAERFQQQMTAVREQMAEVQLQNDRINEQSARRQAVSEFQERISNLESEESEFQDIYDSAYEVLTQRDLLDTSNMYIALWDTDRDQISFPLAYHDGEPVPKEAKNPDNWILNPDKPDEEEWIPKDPKAEWNLEWRAWTARSRRKRDGPTGIGLTEWIIENEEPLLIEGQFEERCKTLEIRFFDIRTQSWLGAPMIADGKVIGVIGLQIFKKKTDEDEVEGDQVNWAQNEGAFEARHEKLLSIMAGQAAVAVANARKHDTVQRERDTVQRERDTVQRERIRRQEELAAIGEFQQQISHPKSLKSEYADIYNAAHLVLTQRELLDTSNMYIALWDTTRDQISFPLAYHDGELVPEEAKNPDNWILILDIPDKEKWMPKHPEQKWDSELYAYATRARRKRDGPKGIGLTEWIVENEEPLLIEQDFETKCEELGIKAFDIRTQSWLGAPMIAAGKVIGVIGLQIFKKKKSDEDEVEDDQEELTRDEGVFEARHEELLLTIAGQAALAIDNARLLADERERVHKRQKRLDDFTLISLSMAEASLDPHPGAVLMRVARTTNEIGESDLTGDVVSIFRYDARERQFTQGARVWRDGRATTLSNPEDLPTPGGLVDTIATEQRALYLPDERAEAKLSGWADEQGVEAFAGLPLVVGGDTVGALLINFTEARFFSVEERELFEFLAGEAAIAIGYTVARESAFANEQLAALGVAAAALQHRLNNTINVALPAIMRLRIRHGDNPDTTRILDVIERNIKYANEVINGMQGHLHLGNQEQFTISTVNSLLREAIEDCRKNAIEKFTGPACTILLADSLATKRKGSSSDCQIVIASDLADDLPTMYLRTASIKEVFRVLIENAIKAIYPNSGRIEVSTRSTGSADRKYVEISVADSGKGMTEEVQGRIFREIVPRREQGQGAGLGLWISNILVRNHRGRIDFESEVGEGTTMVVTLPALSRPPIASGGSL